MKSKKKKKSFEHTGLVTGLTSVITNGEMKPREQSRESGQSYKKEKGGLTKKKVEGDDSGGTENQKRGQLGGRQGELSR